MRTAAILVLGVVFGVTLYKSEVVSWFRMQEMFRFQAIHMYGIIGSAVVLGALAILVIKKRRLKTATGEPWRLKDKDRGIVRYLVGGTIFGLGWGLIGACPGPMFILVGSGAWIFLVALAGALLGTFAYGALRSRLPH